MKHDDLDIWRMPPIKWKPIISAVLVYSLCLGGAFYRWMTYSTPITADAALRLFQDERSSDKDERTDRGHRHKERTGAPRTRKQETAVVLASTQTRSEDKTPSTTQRLRGSDGESSSVSLYGMPVEGVYSWDTRGWESASGAKRQMPEVTHNIVTHDGPDAWTTHYYFSEEKQYWTSLRIDGPTVQVTKQRNKVIFGPVTSDTTVNFRPPMLAGPESLEVGQTWEGSWKGSTSGHYVAETFEHTTISVEGAPVEVWAIRMEMDIEGEIAGHVVSEIWFAPKFGLSIKEHWKQDVKASVSDYQSEWTMTLQSLTPRT